ncbi:MAG TPA: acyl carrier protein [Labilithrix sp.]|jgi:acyl carrier protein|nr:acyl carrier protein [Labilithrix sp.]
MMNLKEELRDLIAEIAEIDEVPDDATFKDLGIDSMMGVEIVAAIERKYQVKIDDSELVEVTTLNNAMALVQKKRTSGASEAAVNAAE